MNPILRNILATVAGIIVGAIANITLVNLGPSVFPMPEGADITTMEGLAESMKVMKPVNFIFPFLGHAIGTFIGVLLAVKLAISNHKTIAYTIGLLFLAGGVQMVLQLPSPVWFNALDLIAAYIPMAYLGHLFGSK